MGRNRQLWGKIFSFAGLIDAEWLYRRREFNVGAREIGRTAVHCDTAQGNVLRWRLRDHEAVLRIRC